MKRVRKKQIQFNSLGMNNCFGFCSFGNYEFSRRENKLKSKSDTGREYIYFAIYLLSEALLLSLVLLAKS